MGQSVDPHRPLVTMHHHVTAEVARLMEGFYSNLEDGLFELAYRNEAADHQRFCFELMRELRYRRQNLMTNFIKGMNNTATAWFEEIDVSSGDDEVEADCRELAEQLSEKCLSHFDGLLTVLSRRASLAASRNISVAELPIGPYQVAAQFVRSCRHVAFDRQSIEVVQDLFVRFVLDRLGTVYGACNRVLAEAGYSDTGQERASA